METVELIVYIGIAIVVGGMILAFVAGWDAAGTYRGIKSIFLGDDEQEGFEQISSGQFPSAVLELWDSCGLGSKEMEKTVYVTDDAPLNKTALFEQVKAVRMCKSLQSVANGCGSREDIMFGGAQGPVVLNLRCLEQNGTMSIS